MVVLNVTCHGESSAREDSSISIYNRGPPSRSPGRLTPNPPGGLQLQKHFLTGTKFGTLFGASSEAPGEGFWVPFGGFLGPFLWSSPVGLRGM